MRVLLPITCLVVLFSFVALTQSTTDWRLETALGDTEVYLDKAGELLKEARAGNTQAMRDLGTLIQDHTLIPRSLTTAWWDTAAHRGDEKAMVKLIRYYLESENRLHRNLPAAHAWLRVSAAESVTFTWGCKEVTHDEKWFSEKMTENDKEFSRHLEKRIRAELTN